MPAASLSLSPFFCGPSDLEALRAEIQNLSARIAALEDENATHSENMLIQLRLINQLRESSKKPVTARGEKTIARIAKIDEVLKARGPTTLKELERILGIDRPTMTRLLGKLDMRRYELHSRPGDEREKVLRLKALIR